MAEEVTHPTLDELSEALECAKVITFQLIEFLQRISPSYNMSNNNNYNRNQFPKSYTPNSSQRQRVSRVRPLDEQSISPQFGSEPYSPISMLSSPTRHTVQPIVRPCASVPPSRIIRATNVALSPTLAVGPPPLISQNPDMGSNDSNQTNGIHTISVLVTSTASHTILSNPPSLGSLIQCGTNSGVAPTLPSEEDQMIPFSDRQIVSKYGPISRLMNLINTPTMSAPGNAMSQQMAANGLNTPGARTHPTNVILGRSAVPSLTLIQPLQILTTAFLTDPTSNSQYGRTAFIADPTYQNSYLSGILDSGDNQMNGSSLS